MEPTKLDLEDRVAALRTPYDPDLGPDGRLLAYSELQVDVELDDLRSTVRVLDVATGEPVATFGTPAGAGARWSPAGDRLALCAADEDKGVRVLGSDGSDVRLLAGVEVAELAWRPDGGALAVVAPEPERHGPQDPIVLREAPFRIEQRPLQPRRTRLSLVALDGAVTALTDTLDRDVRCPAFAPDGRLAFVAGTHAHLPTHVHVIEDGGAARRLTPAEAECRWVTWAPDGSALVVVGNEDHASATQPGLYRVDPADGAMHQLAAELDRPAATQEPLGGGGDPIVTPEGDVLFVVDDESRASLVRVPLAGGPAERLIAGGTTVVRGLALAGETLVTILGDWRTPAEIFVSDARGGERRQLTDHNERVLADVAVEPEDRRFTAPDGLEVQGWLLRATGSRPPGPAPLLLHIHGGPHGVHLPIPAELELMTLEFVRRGWNVLLMNPRASAGWGAAHWAGVVEGMGVKDGDDFLCALDALVAEGVADPERLAVAGYSYGGYMTNWLLGHTDRFKAGVSGGGPSELTLAYGASGASTLFLSEMGGSPVGRWEAYDRCSPLRYAGNVTTPLLLLHGMEDQQVPPWHAEAMFTLVRERGIDCELVLYPDAAHEFPGAGPVGHRFDYWRRLVAWIVERV